MYGAASERLLPCGHQAHTLYSPVSGAVSVQSAWLTPDGLVVATKAGLTRHGPDVWAPLGRPEYLRQQCLLSLRRLGVDRIDLFQLHRIDDKFPLEDQVGELEGGAHLPTEDRSLQHRLEARERVERAGGLDAGDALHRVQPPVHVLGPAFEFAAHHLHRGLIAVERGRQRVRWQ